MTITDGPKVAADLKSLTGTETTRSMDDGAGEDPSTTGRETREVESTTGRDSSLQLRSPIKPVADTDAKDIKNESAPPPSTTPPAALQKTPVIASKAEGDTTSKKKSRAPKAGGAIKTKSLAFSGGSNDFRKAMKRQLGGRSPFVAQITSPNHFMLNFFPEDIDFQRIIHEAERAIAKKNDPQLIPEGTSGSYFVLNEDGSEKIGVFKPKDEEPFAPLNPKWPKFFQRMCCFCFFGRACLIPNHGYLSEAGGSLVDYMLELDIVPKTRIVWLRSSSFHYTAVKTKRQSSDEFVRTLPAKNGSFQIFVHGYQTAKHWLAKWELEDPKLEGPLRTRFLYKMQKLIILDYIIRNTDRHDDNWLIKYEPDKEILELAAIDNGLAFPIKHPEEVSRWRKFPFGWSELKWAKEPFLKSVIEESLAKLDNTQFVTQLCDELKLLFEHGRLDHGWERIFIHGQMKVILGQIWNLREALAHGESPYELTQKPPMIATRRFKDGARPPKQWQKAFRIRAVQDLDRKCCCFL